MTIPIEVRELLKIKAGDKIEFVELESGGFEVKPAKFVPASILKGMFANTGISLTIEEMNAVIAECGAAAGQCSE